jgi:hypothetical protein
MRQHVKRQIAARGEVFGKTTTIRTKQDLRDFPFARLCVQGIVAVTFPFVPFPKLELFELSGVPPSTETISTLTVPAAFAGLRFQGHERKP